MRVACTGRMTTPPLPPLASFPDLLRSAMGMLSHRIVADSRRNANEAIAALQTRREDSTANRDLIAALGSSPTTAHRELA